jgi:hypothetical protein
MNILKIALLYCLRVAFFALTLLSLSRCPVETGSKLSVRNLVYVGGNANNTCNGHS